MGEITIEPVKPATNGAVNGNANTPSKVEEEDDDDDIDIDDI